jgi:hypothetical protein
MDPDPNPIFRDIKDAKNYYIFIFFFNLPTGTLSSFLKIKNLILCKNYILHALFQSTQHIYEKTNPRGPKTCGSNHEFLPLIRFLIQIVPVHGKIFTVGIFAISEKKAELYTEKCINSKKIKVESISISI